MEEALKRAFDELYLKNQSMAEMIISEEEIDHYLDNPDSPWWRTEKPKLTLQELIEAIEDTIP